MDKFTIQVWSFVRWKFVSKDGKLIDSPEVFTRFEVILIKAKLQRENRLNSFRILKNIAHNWWSPHAFNLKRKVDKICWKTYGF